MTQQDLGYSINDIQKKPYNNYLSAVNLVNLLVEDNRPTFPYSTYQRFY